MIINKEHLCIECAVLACLFGVISIFMIPNVFFACIVSMLFLGIFFCCFLWKLNNSISNYPHKVYILVFSILGYFIPIIPVLKYGLYDYYGKVCFILGLILSYSVLLYLYGTFVKQWKTENRFLVIASAYGLFMLFNMPLRIVPDEITHMLTSYRNANLILGVDRPLSEEITLRKTDNDFLIDNIEYGCNYQMMNEYYDRMNKVTDKAEFKISSLNALRQNDISHVISSIPIAICKILNVNGFWTWISGRMINLAIYVLLVYLAIKIIPFGKNIPFTIALLPMSMQQAMSYSYDSWIIASSIFVVSSALYIKYGKNRYTQLICWVCGFLAISLAMMKSHAYIMIGLFPLCIWIEHKFDTSMFWKWCWRILIVFLTCFLVYAVIDCFFGIPDLFSIPYNPIQWMDGEQGYTWQYLLNNPMNAIILLLRTFKSQSIMYITTMISRGLGWLNINLSIITLLLWVSLLLLSVNGNDPIRIKQGIRYWMLLAIIITVVGILYGLLVNWTVETVGVVLGVQGRYFIPVLILGGLLMYHNTSYNGILNDSWNYLILAGYILVVVELMIRF